ncbi:hypothetical protein [Accumulibacter sp.]|uniref:hypothetical protein n=1 Tax=Accumulibacter sp. TaxID=2053492 RepID=UPI002602DB05|nr:hypothetical protein [Accumulibacter sp.]
MRIVAFLTDACTVREILSPLGEPMSPPPIAPARGTPLWEITDARFSGSVGTLSPNHGCCQGLSEPGTLLEVALDILPFKV